LMVPADGNFVTSIAKANLKAGEVQGQTRQHALLINLLGVKQLVVGVNKMDCDVAKYGKERYDEISNEMASMLTKVGWKKEFIKDSVPMLPISGWMGDNLIKPPTRCRGGLELTFRFPRDLTRERFTFTLSWMPWRRWCSCPLVTPTLPCALLFLEFTRSRELVMC